MKPEKIEELLMHLLVFMMAIELMRVGDRVRKLEYAESLRSLREKHRTEEELETLKFEKRKEEK